MEPILLIALFWMLKAFMAGLCVLLPFYAGLYYALFLIYMPKDGGANPVAGRLWEFDWVVSHYQQLFGFWQSRDTAIGPELFLPPIIGLCCGAFLLWLFARYVRSIFSVDDL
jgi:hypothetical protein